MLDLSFLSLLDKEQNCDKSNRFTVGLQLTTIFFDESLSHDYLVYFSATILDLD